MTSLPEEFARLEAALDAAVTDAEMTALVSQILDLDRVIKAARWLPYPWQHPHHHPEALTDPAHVCGPACATLPSREVPTHGMWLMLGGRGTGKTEGAARYVNDHVTGPPCDSRLPGGHRPLIVAPTQGDAFDACYHGPSGLKSVNPTVRTYLAAGGLSVVWPNGCRARLLGAYTKEDIERLRSAGNTCLVWMEEVAAQRYLGPALDHTRMGLRIGPRPHYVGSTTPKPRPEVRSLIKEPTTLITKGRTRDAVRLDPTVLASYLERYEGTRTGLQELDAILLDDVEGALWSFALIDDHRHRGPFGQMSSVVVGLDPPGSHKPGNAEAGIVVVGSRVEFDGRAHGYVIADLSGHMSPEEWGSTAVRAVHTYGAVGIAAETTYGGEMVRSTIRTIDTTVAIHPMPTKVGKALRAEPIVGLYEQGRVHHVGVHPALETQMTEWVPGESLLSPDRVDALVHAATFLLVKAAPATSHNPAHLTRRVERR